MKTSLELMLGVCLFFICEYLLNIFTSDIIKGKPVSN